MAAPWQLGSWQDPRIDAPTFVGEQRWKTYVTDLMAHKVPGSSSEGAELKKFYRFVCL